MLCPRFFSPLRFYSRFTVPRNATVYPTSTPCFFLWFSFLVSQLPVPGSVFSTCLAWLKLLFLRTLPTLLHFPPFSFSFCYVGLGTNSRDNDTFTICSTTSSVFFLSPFLLYWSQHCTFLLYRTSCCMISSSHLHLIFQYLATLSSSPKAILLVPT